MAVKVKQRSRVVSWEPVYLPPGRQLLLWILGQLHFLWDAPSDAKDASPLGQEAHVRLCSHTGQDVVGTAQQDAPSGQLALTSDPKHVGQTHRRIQRFGTDGNKQTGGVGGGYLIKRILVCDASRALIVPES
ncbi:hypothetical protein chiPu_0021134 [Chiloscyllium punctatum]|uniref:Uncharacterized protein n=1 Tax=Chiloscyllium punctatum TaxID=137246 RepID=A0A401RNN9_CHIPU|nr:hypothetical protein [Chiloscyllium punctatum]